jgi:hypothetical protein
MVVAANNIILLESEIIFYEESSLFDVYQLS